MAAVCGGDKRRAMNDTEVENVGIGELFARNSTRALKLSAVVSIICFDISFFAERYPDLEFLRYAAILCNGFFGLLSFGSPIFWGLIFYIQTYLFIAFWLTGMKKTVLAIVIINSSGCACILYFVSQMEIVIG
jgi:hypothetical protein